jgi:uncharacterized protein (DUF2252 family)
MTVAAETGHTVQERQSRGRAARADAPRSSHASWEPATGRFDPVALIEEEDRTRVPELVPIRHGRMADSPFTFFRGAAAIMAADLAETPVSGITVQACGDAHLSNFGAFAAPDRRLVFDVNDFDETLPAPWEWDVKRLAASVDVAGRARGLDGRQRAACVASAVEGYRVTMRTLAEMGDTNAWYARVEVDDLLGMLRRRGSAKAVARAKRNIAKTRSKDSLRALGKLTTTDGGRLRFISDPPLIVPIRELLPDADGDELMESMGELLSSYRASLPADVRRLLSGYRFVDLARKVVGVGSVGTRAWVILMLGRDEGDPLVLQAKEAEASVLEPFAGPGTTDNNGQRVVEGQRLMQAMGDIMLGWIRTTGIDGVQRDFYLRQLWDAKGSAIVEEMEPDILEMYARLCGATLAHGHARSGDRVAIAAYLGSSARFARAVTRFAAAYADQNERDFRAFTEAIDAGRVEAQTGI